LFSGFRCLPNSEERSVVTDARIADLELLVASQAEAMEALLARLVTLEGSRERSWTPADSATPAESTGITDDEPNRRNFLRRAGIAAVGAAAAMVVNPQPASAVVLNGGENFTGDETSFTYTGVSSQKKAALRGTADTTNSTGVIGVAVGEASAGISGTSSTGYGVFGESLTGYALYSAGRLGLNVLSTLAFVGGPPSAGAFNPGDLVRDGSPNLPAPNSSTEGSVWACVTGGSPGKWRKVAGPGTAGAFHPISPSRVFDSRSGALLSPGSARSVSITSVLPVQDPPLVATAATVNITITGTGASSGYLTAYPTGSAAPNASIINWSGINQTTANGATIALGPGTNSFQLLAAGGPTHVIVDVMGYWL
jgi:hypothetical protein